MFIVPEHWHKTSLWKRVVHFSHTRSWERTQKRDQAKIQPPKNKRPVTTAWLCFLLGTSSHEGIHTLMGICHLPKIQELTTETSTCESMERSYIQAVMSQNLKEVYFLFPPVWVFKFVLFVVVYTKSHCVALAGLEFMKTHLLARCGQLKTTFPKTDMIKERSTCLLGILPEM